MQHDKTKNLIFIGMMGVGKTTIGKKCSRLLSRKFYDTDKLYEKRLGKISETFKRDGESVFRNRESEILESLINVRGAVISTGGGAVLSEKFPLLRQTGIVIWLYAPNQILLSRMEKHAHARCIVRPLAGGIDTLDEILCLRGPLYRQYADIILDTSSLSVSAIAETCVSEFLKKLEAD